MKSRNPSSSSNGVLTVGWERDGEVVEIRLGPKDMILNARDVGHGFRNDGIEPVLMSISVDVGKPLPPRYLYHPKNTAPTSPEPSAPNQARRCRTTQPATIRSSNKWPDTSSATASSRRCWDPAGFTRKVYVGPGGIESDTCRKEMLGIPGRRRRKAYTRDVEDAFLVLEGSLTVGWEEDGDGSRWNSGPATWCLNPAGRPHWFRNNSAGPCTVWSVIGTASRNGSVRGSLTRSATRPAVVGPVGSAVSARNPGLRRFTMP